MRLICQSNLLAVFAVFGAAMLSGCGRKVAPPTAGTPPVVQAEAHRTFPRPTQLPPAHAAEPATQPADLARRLRTAEDAEVRSEVVGELWTLGTPEAVEILRQQFYIERDADVRVDIVAGLIEDPVPGTREVRFGILAAAVVPAQPVEVRTTAIALSRESDDIRVVALLQNLLQDPSEEIREAATEALEVRKEKDPQ